PGQLGIYGFRNRSDYSYGALNVATSRHVREDRVWDILSRLGKRSLIVGVPGTFPPPQIEGCVVADFLTPGKEVCYTHPPELQATVEATVPEYRFDVVGFRTHNKQAILDQIFSMTSDRFRLARQLARDHDWDFFMLHEIGPDRIHHGFWSCIDPAHPRYEPGNPYEDCILDYYRHLDAEIGKLIAELPEGTSILVASDHGAKAMKGGVCINEWLMAMGYLKLKTPPRAPLPLARAEVDWANTLAWGEGGYYARLFFNVQGREPQGILPAGEVNGFAEQLRRELLELADDQGRPMRTAVYRPHELYRQVRGIPPDLTVLFDDLAWRSVGTVGLNSFYSLENDTGPDDANHAMDGIFILAGQDGRFPAGAVQGATLFDVAPTILELLEVAVPADMIGRSLLRAQP
ncbi:MAG: alkaline phosphatase family protein, partial [Chloroflexota bacterium]|nr:alkaline phosphatase family protein [Chloroflexota bacterium]